MLNDELDKLEINVQWKEKTCSQNSITPSSESENKDIVQDTYFSFDGINYHCKRRFVLELIKDYIANNPNTNFEELEKQFPPELHTKSLGVVRLLSSVNERIITHPDLKNRYFLKDNEIIILADGTKVVVNNQWGTLFPKFLKKAKALYHISSCADKSIIHKALQDATSKKPASKLKISFENGSTIMEHDSVSTFKLFVENVGIAQVASLNLPGRKDIPLISKEISDEYLQFQHAMSNGYYLFLNHSTLSLKKLIEDIASKLKIAVSVEILPK